MQRASTGEGHGALCVYPSILVRAVWTKAAGTDLVQCPHFERLGGKAVSLPSCYLNYLCLRERPQPQRMSFTAKSWADSDVDHLHEVRL